jgi:4-methyl-5(b-hydroxyethyl)-thiazole monophosphate biosynthesis
VSGIIVPLAEGFEEIEAVTIIDMLRRADVEVIVAGVGGEEVTGSHGITIRCETLVDSCDVSTAEGIVLPGGMPGTTHLKESPVVRRLIQELNRAGKLIGAICAAPAVLAEVGLLKGKTATSHPQHTSSLRNCRYSEKPVVIDGNIITSRGAGTVIAFAAALIGVLAGPAKAEEILKNIVAH